MSSTSQPLVSALAAALQATDAVTTEIAEYRGLSDEEFREAARLSNLLLRAAQAHGAVIAGELAHRSRPELGSAGLADGFSLIGAEVYADAEPTTVETVLEQLVRSGEAALVLLETPLAHAGGPWLNRLRNEGGRIVITELPPLPSPQDYAPAVDDVVRAVLGPDALK